METAKMAQCLTTTKETTCKEGKMSLIGTTNEEKIWNALKAAGLSACGTELFGPQSNFTPDEQQTYRTVLMRNAEDTGINLFDLL